MLESCDWLRGFEYHEQIGSTQERARQLSADRHQKLPALVLAARQTAGRGRGSHSWWSDAGALTFSVVVDPVQLGLSFQPLSRLSLASSLAVCHVLSEHAPDRDCGIKWPNDVYLDGSKICGLLVETANSSDGVGTRTVVGVGINVNNSVRCAPPEIAQPITSLIDEMGTNFDLTHFLLSLLGHFSTEFQALGQRDPGQAARWQSRSLLNGRQITLEFASRRSTGRCLGIDEDGALLLRTTARIERWLAGTVVASDDV